MNKYVAFTLAEGLIALGVIAILAALSVTATTKTKPDENIIMFRRAYSTTSKIVKDLLNDTELYPNANGPQSSSTLGSAGPNKKGLKKGPRTVNNNFAINFMSRMNAIDIDSSTGSNEKKFYTPDGIYWDVVDNMYSDGYATIYIETDHDGGGCYFDESTCLAPKNFRLNVDYLGNITPVKVNNRDAKDNMAITYLRYSKLNKQSQMKEVYSDD